MKYSSRKCYDCSSNLHTKLEWLKLSGEEKVQEYWIKCDEECPRSSCKIVATKGIARSPPNLIYDTVDGFGDDNFYVCRIDERVVIFAFDGYRDPGS
jgi:hypothetical protein